MRNFRNHAAYEAYRSGLTTSMENANELHITNVPLCEPEYPDAWVGFDYDGTLATYHDPNNPDGTPIRKMVERCKQYISNGVTVKVFTARAATTDLADLKRNVAMIEEFCIKHIGVKLEVTAMKDRKMVRCYDDLSLIHI